MVPGGLPRALNVAYNGWFMKSIWFRAAAVELGNFAANCRVLPARRPWRNRRDSGGDHPKGGGPCQPAAAASGLRAYTYTKVT